MKDILKTKKYILLSLILLPVIFGLFFLAKSAFGAENLADTCDLDNVNVSCQSLSALDCRALLEKCETYYQQQSDQIQNDINKTSQQKKTLQNKISSLNSKIKSLKYQISQSNLVISDLKLQIDDTTKSITTTSAQIDDKKAKLADILRTINGEDQKSMIEVLIFENDLSDFFGNLTSLDALGSKTANLLSQIKVLKENLEKEMSLLDDEKGSLEKTVKIQTLQKNASDTTKKDQEQYLKLTEQQYQQQLKKQSDIAKKASEIRARIFELFGVAKAPTFGEAYEYAKYAAGITGIRPAFLLAILTQESNLGKNVGQCFLANTSTGAGKNIKSGFSMARVMNPTRDVPAFLQITKVLGRDEFATPVSCPMSFGWGGAMGPAQFIPSTWNLFAAKIKSATGKPGDPWDIRDAFIAAAIYLTDRGAGAKTYNSEWRASLAYFSGSTTNTKYRFYADSVMSIAAGYEQDIKDLNSALAVK